VGENEAELARALIEGWATAAAQERPAETDGFRAWADRRWAAVARGAVTLMVGHLDLLALPAHPGQGPL
jgi:hypothetical protein